MPPKSLPEWLTHENINHYIDNILAYIAPVKMLAFMSKRMISKYDGESFGWNLKISTNDKLLGEYHNGKLVKGYWLDERIEGEEFQKKYKELKKEYDEKYKITFADFLEKKNNNGEHFGVIDYLALIMMEHDDDSVRDKDDD